MVELIGNKIFLDDNYEIREYYTENGIVRGLIFDGCIQSLMYIDDIKKNNLVNDYFSYYDLPVKLNPNGDKYLMLGGGAFTYSHYYLNMYKDKKIDIVEKDSKCLVYSKKYFYLDELIKVNSDRINIIIDDALNYVNVSSSKYDYILIDLFNGKETIKEIYDECYFNKLLNMLNDRGIIIINYIINDDSDRNIVDKIVKNTKEYKIIINNNYYDVNNNIGNVIILLSNYKLNIV